MADLSNFSASDLISSLGDSTKAVFDPNTFTASFGDAATWAANQLGVDPSVVLGQWGLETGWGKHVIPGTNNLGNIKDVSGGGTAATDNQTGSNDNYRNYDNSMGFAKDYVSLLQRKYPQALNTGSDANAFFTGLKSGGYAEDKGYVSKGVSATGMVAKAPTFLQTVGDNVASSISGTANAAEGNGLQGANAADLIASLNSSGNAPDAPQAASTPSSTTATSSGTQAPDGGLANANAADLISSLGDTPQQTSHGFLDGVRDFGAGAGAGVGKFASGLEGLVGKGASYVGANNVGSFLQNDAQNAYKSYDNQLNNITGGSTSGKVGDFVGGIAPSLLVPLPGAALAGRILPAAANPGVMAALARASLGGSADSVALGAANRAIQAGGTGQDVGQAVTSGMGTDALLGGVLGPVVSGIAGGVSRVNAARQAEQAAAAKVAGYNPAELNMGGKIADQVAANGENVGQVASDLRRPAPANMTAMDNTSSPTVAGIQNAATNQFMASEAGQALKGMGPQELDTAIQSAQAAKAAGYPGITDTKIAEMVNYRNQLTARQGLPANTPQFDANNLTAQHQNAAARIAMAHPLVTKVAGNLAGRAAGGAAGFLLGGGPIGAYAGQEAGAYASKAMRDYLTKSAATSSATSQAANSAALQNMVSNPQHLGAVMDAIGASQAEREAVKRGLLQRIAGVESLGSQIGGKTGGLIGLMNNDGNQ